MYRRTSIFWGILLILLGGLILAFNFAGPWLLGWLLFLPWQLWPLAVIIVGLCFTIPALMARRRNLGGLFVPGIPVLAVGCILLFNSWFHAWGAWAWLWPMMVLSVAVGFLLAAWRLQAIWLLIPALVIGANGLLMQYCALTGNWSIWAVLWSIEPLSVGLALLLVNIQKHRPGLLIAGLILCTIAGFAALGMSYIIPGYGWVNLMGPGILLLAGLLLLSSSLLRSTPGQAAIES
jgi:hypothetical protein